MMLIHGDRSQSQKEMCVCVRVCKLCEGGAAGAEWECELVDDMLLDKISSVQIYHVIDPYSGLPTHLCCQQSCN